MKHWIAPLLAVLALGQVSGAVQTEPSDQDVQVMLIGTFHFIPSESDLISTEAMDVLAPDRQAELDAIAQSLATFEPTVVALEAVTEPPEYRYPPFDDFSADVLTENRNERVQLGLRLAAETGVTRVYGIDEQPSGDEPGYFPFGAVMAHAEASGRQVELQAFLDEFGATIEAEQQRLNSLHLGRALAETNTGVMSSADFYYALLEYDLGEAQPGSELNAMWFLRNAKIFAKLQDVTEPGDRVVVFYGAGHNHWLKHLIENTPGYRLVDPTPYLMASVEE